MYKTVRHGENSLQYKILAQEEEGVADVKRRKSPKSVILKPIVIVILLVVGVVASAFLVPLLLGNDFIAVTGTFQKFSVSTLRRSHSGNHVVVIAKKPYGWNAPRTSAPLVEPEKSQSPTEPPPTSAVSTTTSTAASTTFTAASTTTQTSTMAVTTSIEKSRVTPPDNPPRQKQQQQSVRKDAEEGEVVSSKLEPVWYKPMDNWEFQSAGSYFKKTNESDESFLFMGVFLVVSLLIVYCIFKVTVCILCGKDTSTEKEMTELKEHSKRLLKSSGSSTHEDE